MFKTSIVGERLSDDMCGIEMIAEMGNSESPSLFTLIILYIGDQN